MYSIYAFCPGGPGGSLYSPFGKADRKAHSGKFGGAGGPSVHTTIDLTHRITWSVHGGFCCASDGQELQRDFEREVQALAALRHQNLVTFRAINPEQYLIVTEFCELGDLKAYLRRGAGERPSGLKSGRDVQLMPERQNAKGRTRLRGPE